jgi:hypothetical protein
MTSCLLSFVPLTARAASSNSIVGIWNGTSKTALGSYVIKIGSDNSVTWSVIIMFGSDTEDKGTIQRLSENHFRIRITTADGAIHARDCILSDDGTSLTLVKVPDEDEVVCTRSSN